MGNYEKPQAGVDYCGYCKHSIDENGECDCNGFGHAKGSIGTAIAAGSDYFEGAGVDCSCDGFGGDPETHERACRYCSTVSALAICPGCNQAS